MREHEVGPQHLLQRHGVHHITWCHPIQSAHQAKNVLSFQPTLESVTFSPCCCPKKAKNPSSAGRAFQTRVPFSRLSSRRRHSVRCFVNSGDVENAQKHRRLDLFRCHAFGAHHTAHLQDAFGQRVPMALYSTPECLQFLWRNCALIQRGGHLQCATCLGPRESFACPDATRRQC